MQDFEKNLKKRFLEEVGQILADTEQCFLGLENDPDNAQLMDKIFRLAHSLKGGAQAVGFEQIGTFAHVFESYILRVRKGEIPKSPAVISLLLRCNDFVSMAVNALKLDLEANLEDGGLQAEIESAISSPKKGPAEPSAAEVERHIQSEIDKQFFDGPTAAEVAALVNVETLRTEPVTGAFGPLRDQPIQAPRKSADETIRVSLQRLEKLLNFVGEMVILQTMLREQVSAEQGSPLSKTVHQLGKVTKEVQDITLSLRMVSVKTTFQKMQRIVRDASVETGKKVQLHLDGEETELDKTLLEGVGDPLVHLMRNAVDHGIEAEANRIAAGKTPYGNIWLSARHQGGKLQIEVRDDGGGIDTIALRKKAVECGILESDAVISEREALHLIFKPGFTTKNQVTELSGRGVGMDVVKSNVESLQGEVQIETVIGEGTCIKVLLPLTLAIIEGMVVRCGEERFVIPLSQVYESLKPNRDDVQCSVDLSETLILRNECMPIVRLGHSLGRKAIRPAWDCIAIVNRGSERPFAILVDDILGQQQIVIKKLGVELQRLRAFTGTAVLGDGRPALIVEASELAAMARPINREILVGLERKAS